MADDLQLNAATTTGGTIRALQDAATIYWPAGVSAFATTVGTPDVLQVVTPLFGLPVRLADASGYLSTLPVSIAATVTVTGAAGTFPVTDSGGSLTVDAPVGTPVFVRLSDGSAAISTLPVSAASLPLPSGASTAANQAAGNTSLSSIDGKLPALGQALAAASVPVVLTAAQLSTLTPTAGLTDAQLRASAVPVSLTSTTIAGSVAVTGTFWQATQPVSIAGTVAISAASLPLPSGAATAAKQPALGTAGTASADVISVQGVASMTALKVDGSAVTQPVSGTFWQATQPVSIAAAVAVTDNSGSLTVDAPVGTPVFVRLSDGSSAISTLAVSLASVPSHAVTNAGTFAVQESGGALTSLQLLDDVVLAEDAAHASGDKGVMALAVRSNTAASTSGTDGDYQPLITNTTGHLWVDASGQTLTVGSHNVTNAGTFAVQAAQSGTWNVGTVTTLTTCATVTSLSQFAGAAINLGNGASSTGTLRVTLANDSTGIVSLTTSTASIGKLASNTGVTIGAVELAASQTLATVTTVGTVTTCSTVTTVSTLTGGGVAHDGADSGNPHKVGAKATAALSGATLVAAADRTDLYAGVDGVLITRPHTNLEDIVSGVAAITDGSSTSVIAAQGSGVKVYVTSVVIANSSATAVTVDIRDGAAGTVKATFPVPASTGGVVCNLPVPIPFTANTAVCADPSAAASTVTVTLIGFKSKV